MRRLRVGVIGAGAWAVYSHLPVLTRRGGEVELVAVCRRGPELLQSVQEQFGFTFASEDFREVLQHDLDLCLIASPAALHHEHALAAMESGAHVLVEKPFALTTADAWDLVNAAERLGRHLVVAFGYNYLPKVVEFGQALREIGGIGGLEHCALAMASCTRELLTGAGSYPEVGHDQVPDPEPGTWTDPVLSGGGYAQAQLTHLLALAIPLLGQAPQEVAATALVTRDHSLDHHDAATIRFADGAVGTLSGSSSWTGVDGSRDIVVLRATGTEGQWVLDLDAERAYVYRAGWPKERALAMPPGSGHYDCVGPVNAAVDLALGRDVVNRSPGRLAAQTVEVLDAFYRSLRTGVTERVLAP